MKINSGPFPREEYKSAEDDNVLKNLFYAKKNEKPEYNYSYNYSYDHSWNYNYNYWQRKLETLEPTHPL